MFKKTSQEEVKVAIELLIEAGHKIIEHNDFGVRGYHIVAHCFSDGKNECFKPENGVLFKWGLNGSKFGWYKYMALPYTKKRSYRQEMYEAINGNKKNH